MVLKKAKYRLHLVSFFAKINDMQD